MIMTTAAMASQRVNNIKEPIDIDRYRSISNGLPLTIVSRLEGKQPGAVAHGQASQRADNTDQLLHQQRSRQASGSAVGRGTECRVHPE